MSNSTLSTFREVFAANTFHMEENVFLAVEVAAVSRN